MKIPIDLFWGLNPKYMYMYQEEYIREKEEQIKLLDVEAYYHGMYVKQAIASCFSKNVNYPEKPLLLDKKYEKIEEERELTEEEKIEYQKQLLMKLQIMQSNFETGKKK